MKYKEFRSWCNDRAADGCWGLKEALLCLYVLDEIEKVPFWKREKVWKNEHDFIVNNIVKPINKKILEVLVVNKVKILND